MRSVLAAVMLIVPSLVSSAEVDSKFSELKREAERFDGSLSSFLERYIGDCTDPETAAQCYQAAQSFRQKVTGKKFIFTIGEEQVNNLTPGRAEASGALTVNLTPFFPAGNYAVCQGTPRKTDANGNPVFPWVALKGKAPADDDADHVLRMVSNRQVRLQVIFTPEGVWQLPRRGGGKMMGVRARFNGVLASAAGTGQPLAVYLAGGR